MFYLQSLAFNMTQSHRYFHHRQTTLLHTHRFRSDCVACPNWPLLSSYRAMLTWMNAQQYQHYVAHAPAPSGWKGSWPPTAPVGYPGPPPPPQGMKIDPKMWYQGQWQFNPMYRSVASAQAQAWAPHPMWQQQAADFNPYKRKPNPGDAAYWGTKLSDNPLGLHNMHIRYVHSISFARHSSYNKMSHLSHAPDVFM